MNIKPLKFIVLILTVFAGLSSCKKDKDNDNDGSGGDFYFTVKVDGNSFSGDMSKAEGFGLFKYHEGTLSFSIAKDVANPATGTFLMNILSGYNGAGSYKVGVGGGTNYARYTTGSMVGGGTVSFWTAETGSGSTANNIGTGTIVVSSDKNGVVEGTFSFDGYNNADHTTKHFTEGKFRLKVQ
ncbi:hypothetical protein FW774_14645 [Pedobacter sp. BS3]|uniref:hypothetical protein n=1 Tax=Pedobacter sp. BS3 TaxID=2567937 RepID=UPI0011EE88A9|nr:hypothetical protein [Pedobacter sp. BS3]TZF82730.1 hypothetical protein FW774_14645 [Pedobacter sp. BS3]